MDFFRTNLFIENPNLTSRDEVERFNYSFDTGSSWERWNVTEFRARKCQLVSAPDEEWFIRAVLARCPNARTSKDTEKCYAFDESSIRAIEERGTAKTLTENSEKQEVKMYATDWIRRRWNSYRTNGTVELASVKVLTSGWNVTLESEYSSSPLHLEVKRGPSELGSVFQPQQVDQRWMRINRANRVSEYSYKVSLLRTFLRDEWQNLGCRASLWVTYCCFFNENFCRFYFSLYVTGGIMNLSDNVICSLKWNY